MIEKVVYEVIGDGTHEEAAEIYYHQNMVDIDPMFIKDYEEYELRESSKRNAVLNRARKKYDVQPDVNKSIYGPSSLSNNVVIVAKI